MIHLEAQIASAVTAPQAWIRPGKGSMQASPSVRQITSHFWCEDSFFVLMT